jgi:hypothetical protein
MMASADIPHGEARERSMDIVRERTDLSDRANERSSVKTPRGSTICNRAAPDEDGAMGVSLSGLMFLSLEVSSWRILQS